MKRIIVLLIVFIIMIAVSVSLNDQKVEPNQPKQKTITECDFFGFSADQIIADKEAEGYEFIGSTRGVWCTNDLHFRLKEDQQ